MTAVDHAWPLPLPALPKPRFSTVRLDRSVGRTTSPFTFVEEVQKNQGARWLIEFEYPPMKRAMAAQWQAFLLKLQGGFGTFYAGDPDALTPQGTALGSPLVKGASQTGNQIETDGWTPVQAEALAPGDYFQIGDFMYQAVDTVVADSNGDATVTFEPSLRVSPADNAGITLTNCVTKMRLVEPTAQWQANALGLFDGFVLRGIEALG